MTPPTPHFEPLKTMKKAAEELAFPSPDALRKFLDRRPGLVGDRYRRTGRSYQRLLTESEVARIAEITVTVSRGNSPGH